ncbi:unnamed protein product [Camellia sinensis]
MKPSLTPSSRWALMSPNPPSSSKASMIVSIGSDCVGLSLNSWIAKVPGVLCDKVIQKWGVTLPFMFKVLSVSKALSIQAHPDKEFAGFLHKTLPDVFKDDNYKPEVALALTEFGALCGFISLKADQTGTVVEVLAKDGKPVSVDTKDIVYVTRSQSDSDVEVFESAEGAMEGGDLGIIGDDVFALGDRNFSPAPGVETICFFPKNPSTSVAAGEEGELIVGMKNEGESSAASDPWGIYVSFISVILLSIVENAAKHARSVIFAFKNKISNWWWLWVQQLKFQCLWFPYVWWLHG